MQKQLPKLYILLALICLSNMAMSQANFVWAKQMGGTGDDAGRSIAIDSKGNIYTTGSFVGTADFDPGPGTSTLFSGPSDIFISKLDPAGNFIWAKQIGGTGYNGGQSLAIDISGNVYITGDFNGTADFNPGVGTFYLTSVGTSDVFICKLDTAGNFVWAKQFGGPSFNTGNSICLDNSGNVYTTGYFEGTADFDPGAGTFTLASAGGEDIFISKWDAAGNFIWAKSLGGTNGDYGRSVTIDAWSNVYTTGHFTGTADFDPSSANFNLTSVASSDIFICKLDGVGNFMWAKAMGGSGPDVGFSIALDAMNNVYTTGYFENTADFDPGTGTFTLTSAWDTDIFISKLDATGNFIWAKAMSGGLSYDSGVSIALDAWGNVFTAGYFGGTVDFDPGSGTFNLTSPGGLDIFISKLDAAGNFIWAKKADGPGDVLGCSIALDAQGNIFTTGYFYVTVDFDPGTGIFNLTSAGSRDVFVHKIVDAPTVNIPELNFGDSEIKIFPNPNHGSFQLQIDAWTSSVHAANELNKGELVIYNCLGQKVHEQTVSHGTNEIKTTGLANGLYQTILFSNNQKIQSGKLVVD